MIRVGIIGLGYAGGEVARYVIGHPGAEITYIASTTFAGKPISEAYPSFLGQDLPACQVYNAETAADRADVFFQTNKDGAGMALAPELLEFGKKMIDLPADFRLKDLAIHRQYYGTEHTCPDLLAEAVYGLADVNAEEIASARLVANPGCYATAALLALAPLAAGRLIQSDTIIIDAKSGVSGAGRSAKSVGMIFTEVNEGFRAYKVGTHQHTPEIEQELSKLSGEKITLSFTPHMVPMNRGIFTTVYAGAARDCSTSELIEAFRDYYRSSAFVIVLDEGRQPSTKDVSGTNYSHIGIFSDQRTGRVIVTCAIDNMGKGAAGQAVQNMNLICGLAPETGLTAPAVYP